MLAGIVHQWRQHAIQHQLAQRLLKRLGITHLHWNRAIGSQMRELALAVSNARGKRDLHPQMGADGIKDPVDRIERVRRRVSRIGLQIRTERADSGLNHPRLIGWTG